MMVGSQLTRASLAALASIEEGAQFLVEELE